MEHLRRLKSGLIVLGTMTVAILLILGVMRLIGYCIQNFPVISFIALVLFIAYLFGTAFRLTHKEF